MNPETTQRARSSSTAYLWLPLQNDFVWSRLTYLHPCCGKLDAVTDGNVPRDFVLLLLRQRCCHWLLCHLGPYLGELLLWKLQGLLQLNGFPSLLKTFSSFQNNSFFFLSFFFSLPPCLFRQIEWAAWEDDNSLGTISICLPVTTPVLSY